MLIPFLSLSQTKTDKSFDLLLQKSDSCFQQMNYKCALEFAEQAETQSKNDVLKNNTAKTKKAASYFKLRLFDYALKTIKEVKLTNPNNKKELENYLKALNIKANVHYSKYEDELAIKNYLLIDSICEKHNHISETQIKALQNIGSMFLRGYEDGKKPKHLRAQHFFQLAYDKAEKANFQKEKHMAGINLGSTYLQMEKPDFQKTLSYYKASKNYFEQNYSPKELNDVYWAYSSLHTLQKDYQKAEEYFLKRIKMNTEKGGPHEIGTSYWSYAGYLVERENYEKAILNYQKAIDNLNTVQEKDFGIIASCYFYISTAYSKKGDDKKAYTYLTDYLVYKDSLDIKQNQIAFNELETKYQTEKKEQEIKLLSAENELAQKQKYLFIGLIGLLILIGFAVFYLYRNKIKTAEKINELNEMKSRFFANISHEFRTPLTLIKSPIQQLHSSVSDESQVKQLALLDKNADRMLELVDQLLELSKIDSGKFNLILKEGNLTAFLKSIAEPFEYQAKENQILFKSSIPSITENHFFDKDVIQKIVTNLLSNALKYTSEQHQINFDAKVDKESLLISVSNSGVTLKKEELPKLFERFYQKKEGHQGVGIGLALVKELVDLYEGSLFTQLENNVLTFTISLPLTVKSEEKQLIAIEPILIVGDESDEDLPILLLVDDHAEIRMVLRDIFSSNYRILEAKDGEAALSLAQKEIPDCIISDVMMPKLDGFAFTKAIKSNELTSFIPVILLTAQTASETHLEALKSTADSFLTKPFNHEIVKATVSQLIAERKKLQQRYSQELILKPVDIVINSVDEKFLQKLQVILDTQLANAEFTAEEFAGQIGMSRMQLHRKLKSLLGVSATEFIRNERLKNAAELLKKGNGNISEIAYSVGFNDISYFSKCFKEEYGCTPTEYAERK